MNLFQLGKKLVKINAYLVFNLFCLVVHGQSNSDASMHSEHKTIDQHSNSHYEQHQSEKSNSHEQHHNDSAKEHDHHGAISIKKEDIGLFEIDVVKVQPGEIVNKITIPGEVSLNKDQITHIVPRISGIVKEVYVNIGQEVHQGDTLATLESAELADAKSQYLASLERMKVNKEIYDLVDKLKKEGVSFTKEYLDAKQQYAEANIQLKNAKQKLLTFGLKEKQISTIETEDIDDFMRFNVVSPVEGIILDKHISIGEFIKDDRDTMTVVNLKNVWINLNVFQDDFPDLAVGTKVSIYPKHESQPKIYEIAYMAPVVSESTRTGLARIIAPNVDGLWRPGEFVQGTVVRKRQYVDKLIPKSAIQFVNGMPNVFVEDNEHEGTFFAKAVVLGQSDSENYNVLSGVEQGDYIVATGSFALKAQASKSALKDGHNH